MQEELYTSGQFAKAAGVTLRTVRYYDDKGILKPSHYSESGYRLYTEKDLLKLKRIIALKYIGLSLDEVSQLELDNYEKESILTSLRLQKSILNNRINQMKIVLNTIEEAEKSMEIQIQDDLNETLQKIRDLELNSDLIQKSVDASNLNANIKLQDKFGSNSESWYDWVFDKLEIQDNYKILEIGCGTGALWSRNIKKLEKMDNVKITLTDMCEDMVLETMKNLNFNKNLFEFKSIDTQDIDFNDLEFDLIIANHILFYVQDIDKSLLEIKRVLKDKGKFYCSTIGNEHMNELKELTTGFNKKIDISEDKLLMKFGEDNAEKILNKYFKNINKDNHRQVLIVDELHDVLEYIYTIPGDILDVVETKKKDFESYVQSKMSQNGSLNITASNYLFRSEK